VQYLFIEVTQELDYLIKDLEGTVRCSQLKLMEIKKELFYDGVEKKSEKHIQMTFIRIN